MSSIHFAEIFQPMKLERLTGVIESGFYLKSLFHSNVHFHEMIRETVEGKEIFTINISLSQIHHSLETRLAETETLYQFGTIGFEYYAGYKSSLETLKGMIELGHIDSPDKFIHSASIMYYFAYNIHKDREDENV